MAVARARADGRLATYATRIHQGARAIDLVEEKAENDARLFVNQNRTSLEALAANIRELELVTGDQYLHGDSPTAVIEAYSHLARLWATGTRQGGPISRAVRSQEASHAQQQRQRLRQAAQQGSAPGLMARLQDTLDFFRESLRQAARLAKAQREGKLGNLEGYLNESLGLTEEAAHVEAVEQGALKIMGSTFSLRLRIENAEFNVPSKAPPVLQLEGIGLRSGSPKEVAQEGRSWLTATAPLIAARMPAPFVLSQRGVNKMKQVKVYEGENVAAHFEAVAALPELLENSEVLARKPDSEGKDVAFYERRYAWAMFPDGQRRHVLMTVRYLLQTAEPPRMYSLEALEVRDALEAFNDGEPSGLSAPSSAATKLASNLTDFMAGVKSEDKAVLSLSDHLEALSAALGEQVQAQPEQQPALLQRAREHLATAHATWAAQPTSTSAQQQALRSLDAVLTVLPPEARAQLGGFLQLSSLSTAAARQTEIEKRFTQLTDYLAQPPATQAGDASTSDPLSQESESEKRSVVGASDLIGKNSAQAPLWKGILGGGDQGPVREISVSHRNADGTYLAGVSSGPEVTLTPQAYEVMTGLKATEKVPPETHLDNPGLTKDATITQRVEWHVPLKPHHEMPRLPYNATHQPTGPRKALSKRDTHADNIRATHGENEAADVMAKHGYEIEQIKESDKSPDLKINQLPDKADVYSPQISKSLKGIWDFVDDKVARQNAPYVVIRLEPNAQDISELKEYFDKNPIAGLKQIFVVKESKLYTIY